MITKQQFIDSVLKEIRIMQHLYTKILPGTFDYRPTPKQRSMLELMQYLSHSLIVMVEGIKKGKVENFQQQMEHTHQMKPEEFPAKMSAQANVVEIILQQMTDEELNEEIDLFSRGMKLSRTLWLFELVLKSMVGYKMQLFLYIKASGNSDIGTRDLWWG
jgi:hypothetical protein